MFPTLFVAQGCLMIAFCPSRAPYKNSEQKPRCDDSFLVASKTPTINCGVTIHSVGLCYNTCVHLPYAVHIQSPSSAGHIQQYFLFSSPYPLHQGNSNSSNMKLALVDALFMPTPPPDGPRPIMSRINIAAYLDSGAPPFAAVGVVRSSVKKAHHHIHPYLTPVALTHHRPSSKSTLQNPSRNSRFKPHDDLPLDDRRDGGNQSSDDDLSDLTPPPPSPTPAEANASSSSDRPIPIPRRADGTLLIVARGDGYNLQDRLGLSTVEYKKVAVSQRLDVQMCFSSFIVNNPWGRQESSPSLPVMV
jgi:hypothetical protein